MYTVLPIIMFVAFLLVNCRAAIKIINTDKTMKDSSILNKCLTTFIGSLLLSCTQMLTIYPLVIGYIHIVNEVL